MTKILILDGDNVQQEIKLEHRFLFIITKKKVYHMDTTDGNLWVARPDLKNLGKGHRAIIKKAVKK